ncbi:G kinase-anchoring protein 1-like [Schistocerca serialis cubense]|uniref:G kinase-anchoring protein 1-like n=1 Tax=Schistocerca serialis cubense TaxID=2023355 RepID=UPI00214EC99F|nr:G kinase-anchoring protein 1-like [Schistocerca serialis cubense]
MATAVASRFAVLTVEGEDDYPKKSQQKKKTDNKKSASGTQKSDANQKKKNKKQENGKQQNQQKVNAKPKAKSSTKGDGNKQASSTNKKKSATQDNQWNQWKQKDSEFVEESYERDLQQAILLSKLDYEEKKDVYEQLKKESQEQEKRQAANGGNKRAKKQQNRAQPMSLEQFNNMVESDGLNAMGAVEESESEQPSIISSNQIEHDTTFFERIQSDTKKVLDREHSEELRKAREPFLNELLLVAQLQDALEKKKEENELLKQEIAELREELLNVRTRNKKLCQILAHGEMKDKAEVLLEVDRLQQMRDELSSEVSSLHTLLEQERSKVRALTSDTKNKSQNKKRSASETAQ